MKHCICFTLLLILVFSCSSSGSSERKEDHQQAAEATPEQLEKAAELKAVLMDNKPMDAFELLQKGDIRNSLQISEDVWFWYETDPYFKSWLVSTSKIEQGPEYSNVIDLQLAELLDSNETKELLIHSDDQSIITIDAYSFFAAFESLSFYNILETRYTKSSEEQDREVKIDLNDPDFGIPNDFNITKDVHRLLYSNKFFKVPSSVLEAEKGSLNISSYYKFYSKDLEEAKRVLTTPWDPDMPGHNGDYSDKLDTLDIRAGYMEVRTPQTDGFRYTQYVYWNLSDGRKLFAMNEVGEEPFSGEVTTDDFEFRIFNQDRWEPADIGDLQELISGKAPKKGKKLQETALFKKAFSDYPDFLATSFVFYLPQKGKDIRIEFTEMEDADIVDSKTITLKFNNGRFEYLSD